MDTEHHAAGFAALLVGNIARVSSGILILQLYNLHNAGGRTGSDFYSVPCSQDLFVFPPHDRGVGVPIEGTGDDRCGVEF